MRQKLNENPTVQAALIGILVIVVGFMFYSRVISQGSADAPLTGVDATTIAPAVDAATSSPAPTGPPKASAVDAPSGGFEAGPGLPAKLVDAYDSGDTVVLLVIREHPQGCYSGPTAAGAGCGGIDDRKLSAIVEALRVRPSTAVFVTHALGIWRYSRIAQGVDVSRVPALITLQPKPLANGPLPTASVSYGVRGPESVLQAVTDAEYQGRTDIPYYPE